MIILSPVAAPDRVASVTTRTPHPILTSPRHRLWNRRTGPSSPPREGQSGHPPTS